MSQDYCIRWGLRNITSTLYMSTISILIVKIEKRVTHRKLLDSMI